MSGFYTDYGYYGEVEKGQYMLFSTIDEYLEYINERSNNANEMTDDTST